MFLTANAVIQQRMYELLDESQQKMVENITNTMAENPYKLPDIFCPIRFRGAPHMFNIASEFASEAFIKDESEKNIKYHREVAAFLTQIGFKCALDIATEGFYPASKYGFVESINVSIEPQLISDNFARIQDVSNKLDFPRAKIKEEESIRLQKFIADNFPGLWGYFFYDK